MSLVCVLIETITSSGSLSGAHTHAHPPEHTHMPVFARENYHHQLYTLAKHETEGKSERASKREDVQHNKLWKGEEYNQRHWYDVSCQLCPIFDAIFSPNQAKENILIPAHIHYQLVYIKSEHFAQVYVCLSRMDSGQVMRRRKRQKKNPKIYITYEMNQTLEQILQTNSIHTVCFV